MFKFQQMQQISLESYRARNSVQMDTVDIVRRIIPYFCRRMKKGLLLLFLCFVQLALFGQPLTRDNYLFLVNSNSSRNCPMYDDGCTVKSLSYRSNVLHFNIVIPEKTLRGRLVEDVRTYLSERLTHRQEWYLFTYIYDHLTDVNGGLSYDFHLEDDNKHLTDSAFTIHFTSEEYRALKAARNKSNSADNKTWKARHEVQMYVDEMNRECPRATDAYLTCSSVSVLNDMVSLVFVFKEQGEVTFATVKAVRDRLEHNLVQNLKQNPRELGYFIQAGYALLYSYLDIDTKESMEIYFPLDKLKVLYAQSKNTTPATEAQLDAYMTEFAQRFVETTQLTADTTTGWISDGEYENRILQFTLSMQKDSFDLGRPSEELEVLKKTLAFALKMEMNRLLAVPDDYEGAVVTKDMFYQHLKGVRIVFLEKNTHRGMEAFYTTEEFLNLDAPSRTFKTDETSDHIIEYVAFSYAVEVYEKRYLPLGIDGDTMQHMQIQDEDLVIDVQVEDVSTLDANALKNDLTQLILLTYDDEFWTQLTELGLGIRYRVRTAADSKPIEVYISNEELTSYYDSDTLNLDRALEILYEIVRNFQPEHYDAVDYISQDSIALNDQYVIYYYTVQEDNGLMMQSLRADSLLYKEEIKQNFASGNPLAVYMLQVCVAAHRGIQYQYIDSRNKRSRVVYTFRVEDLKRILDEL